MLPDPNELHRRSLKKQRGKCQTILPVGNFYGIMETRKVVKRLNRDGFIWSQF